ncbi:MAG: flagellin [bacterium]
MNVNTNISTMFALNSARMNGIGLRDNMERLSSGLRINKGADDASGLAITKGMEAQIRGLHTAIENVEDGINMIHTVDAVIEEATQMLMRMRDLALRGANEAVLTTADNEILQNEVASLLDGIQQIAGMTTFNTKHLTSLDGEYAQVGPTTINDWTQPAPADPAGAGDPDYEAMKDRVLNAIAGSTKLVYGMLGIAPEADFTLTVNFTDVDADGQGPTLATGGGNGSGDMVMNIDVYNFLDAAATTARVGYDPTVHSFTPEMVIAHEMTHAIQITTELTNGFAGSSSWGREMLATVVSGEVDKRASGAVAAAAVTAAIGGLLTSDPAGSAEYAEVALAGRFIRQEYGYAAMERIVDKVTESSMDFEAAILDVLSDDFADFIAFEAAADTWSLAYVGPTGTSYDTDGVMWTNKEEHLKFCDPDYVAEVPAYEGPAHHFSLQIGPDTGSEYNVDVVVPWVTVGSLDYLAFGNALTRDDALRTVDTVDIALDDLNNARAFLGIQENRLRSVVNDMNTESINVAAAKSRLMDADMAVELADMTKRTMLQQTEMMAAAASNAQPQTVLYLIGQNIRSV